jgi:hypothetical protein
MDPLPSQAIMNSMDAESSVVSRQQAGSMIVVTLTQAAHDELTGGDFLMPPTSRGVMPSLPRAYQSFLNELSERYAMRQLADWELPSIGARCLVFETTGHVPRREITESLGEDPRVEIAQPLNLFQVLGGSYDDPYVDLQHGFKTMQVERSHQWATGNNVAVAVVDTGADVDHPDLRARIELARNFVDQDAAAFRQDLHGTAVTAVIGAEANNAAGIVGIAPKARLHALKGCWQTEFGVADAVCSSFTLAKGIDFAVSSDVDVINLSLGGPPDPLLEALVKNALARGIAVVGAVNAKRPDSFPVYIPGVIAVAPSEDGRAQTAAAASSSVRAPGHKIFSAKPNGDYGFVSGSSISAAHVSGLVALIRERRPHLSEEEMSALLESATVRTRGSSPRDSVSACRALSALVGAGQC